MRTIVELPEEQIEKLARISRRTRASRARLIREAVEEYLQRHCPENDDEAFGLWKQSPTDGIDHQDRLRNEWEK